MNVLAHLHLASLSGSSLLGNVMADFVRGDPYQQYPKSVAEGIMLHRRIDALIDHLPEVKTAKCLFATVHQRVAPITLDIVWDHFLAKYWHEFVDFICLSAFNQLCQTIISPELDKAPAEFGRFMGYLWRDSWLLNYADLAFVQRVLVGMSKQRPRLAILSETINDVKTNYQQLEHLFRVFYPRLCKKALYAEL
ncbi:ACP phosphodiesterase [Utexia brackfieldae]|uniref:acyl carrier protein phosphodiesterase n=1 Tax=Utexia brackfieldae TaxID=3074108 RepID=UPI00370D8D44